MTYSSLNRSSPEKIREWQRRSKQLGRGKQLERGDRVVPPSRLRARPLDEAERERRRQVRLEVWRRDGGCLLAYVPGAGDCFGGPTYHHRRKDGQGGAYTVENGACLCAGHNDRLESDADLARLAHDLGLVVRRCCDEYEALGR